ncbi:MAG: ribokinase [Pseudomonadota bacterium]
MAVWNLGSINIDNVYSVPHLPAPGETLGATEFNQGLGGKGANMSVAIARAAARVIHIGAVGVDGKWAVDRLLEYGVDTRRISVLSMQPTGHANIAVADDGENQIVVFAGSNKAISDQMIGEALSESSSGDIFLTQNETNGQHIAAEIAKQLGLRVVYAAAPFDVASVQKILPFVDLLVLNEVEADQLETELGRPLHHIDIADVVITLGSKGCVWWKDGHVEARVPALVVDPVDTTGAGDTFTGYLVAGLDRGMPMRQALDLATQAAALMVTRLGTADVIPDLKEIEDIKLG